MTATGRPFRLLVVCTGNICRSPVVTARLSSGLGPDSGVAVSSAGLQARVGEPIDPGTAAAAGLEPTGSTARQLTAQLARDSDLVLVMTAAQRAGVVTLAPGTVRRTYTLRQFTDLAELVAGDPAVTAADGAAERLAALVRAVPRARSRRVAGEDDVEDPYRRSPEVHAAVVAQLDRSVGRLLAVLGRPPLG